MRKNIIIKMEFFFLDFFSVSLLLILWLSIVFSLCPFSLFVIVPVQLLYSFEFNFNFNFLSNLWLIVYFTKKLALNSSPSFKYFLYASVFKISSTNIELKKISYIRFPYQGFNYWIYKIFFTSENIIWYFIIIKFGFFR